MEKKVISIGAAKKHEAKKQENKKKEDSENLKSNEGIEYCSFCKRPNTMVPKMVKGPGVNICSECALIAIQYLILQDGVLSSEAQKVIDLLWGMPNK